MSSKPDQASFAKKLSELSQKIGFIEFDSENRHQKYKYASAASVLRKVNVAAGEVGLAALADAEVLQFHLSEDSNGKTKAYAVVKVTITLLDTDTGFGMSFSGVGSGSDKGDKAVMKATTAAKKYAWADTLILGWGAMDPEDDGTEEISHPLVDKIQAVVTLSELEALKPAVGKLTGRIRAAVIDVYREQEKKVKK